MKELIRLTIAVFIAFWLVACDSQDKKESADAQVIKEIITAPERPTDEELHTRQGTPCHGAQPGLRATVKLSPGPGEAPPIVAIGQCHACLE